MTTDLVSERGAEKRCLTWQDATGRCHGLAAAEIPYLPEPPTGTAASPVPATKDLKNLAHMAAALWGLQAAGVQRLFELRLVAGPSDTDMRNLRLFLVARSSPHDDSSSGHEPGLLDAAGEDAQAALRMMIALMPPRVPCSWHTWRHGQDGGAAADAAGYWSGLTHVAHLRKSELLTWAPELDTLPLQDRVTSSRLDVHSGRSTRMVVPAGVPQLGHFLQDAVTTLASARGQVVLRVCLQPTQLDGDEYAALAQMSRDLDALLARNPPTKQLVQKARDAAVAVLAQDRFFRFTAQVLGDEQESVRAVAAAWVMEYAGREKASGVEPPTVDLERWDAAPSGGTSSGVVAQYAEPLVPAHPSQRPALLTGAQIDNRLARLSNIASIAETGSLWGLPPVVPGGRAGLRSRLSNPFEQLPLSTRDRLQGDGLLPVGQVRHRGQDTTSQFVLPALPGTGGGDNILDKVTLVVGAPGSGKTNFTLNFLRHLHEMPAPVPFLILDPTQGHEFRSVAPQDLIVYTVGVDRLPAVRSGGPEEAQDDFIAANPLRFNPFAVPAGVMVQTHITRLMACFRSAFWMWDPLPAIFEEAITAAYASKLGVSDPRRWNAATYLTDEQRRRCPTLSDVRRALGSPDEPGTVMARMMQMWSAGGQATENSSTIVASSVLRLESLSRNYGHILDDRQGDFVDVADLLQQPVVLELGAIGDGQALALVSSFLLVSLVGCIETRGVGRHMLVIEEAHRLLSAEQGGGSTDAGNSSAQAARDLNNMLAEVRKYGQGVMILDQRPSSLVGGVIDNAYTVALHRLNEQRGFDHLSDMLNLTPDQRRYARVGLETGEAVMLDRLLGAPVLVRPPRIAQDHPDEPDSHRQYAVWRERAAALPASGHRRGPDGVPPARELQIAHQHLQDWKQGGGNQVLAAICHALEADHRTPSRSTLRRACQWAAGDTRDEVVDAMIWLLQSGRSSADERLATGSPQGEVR